MSKLIRKHKKLMLVVFVVLIAVVLTIVMISKNKNDKQTEVTQQQSTIRLEKMDLAKSIRATGTIQSKRTRTISASVNGLTVQKVAVAVGDSVEKGDTLATFDESDLQDTLEDAKESLADAQSESNRSISSAKEKLSDAIDTYNENKTKLNKQVLTTKKEWTQAKETVSQLKKKVKSAKSAERKSQLQQQLTSAQEKQKQAKAAYDTAVSDRENTNRQNQSNVSSAKDAVASAESSGKKSVKEAQKQVDEAAATLDKCSITAPISGIVTAVDIESGDTYTGGDMFQIDDTSSFTVSTTVDEYDISNVSVGQRVIVLTEATDEDELEGKITFVAPATSTSSTSAQTGSAGSNSISTSTTSSEGYEVKIKLNSSDKRLKMGLTAKCSIIQEEAKDVFAVPYDALHKNSSGENVVYVADSATSSDSGSSENNYREVVVTQGMESDYYVEISGSGLSEGMSVIIPTDKVSSEDSQEEKNENMFSGNKSIKGTNGNGMTGNRGNRPSGGAPNMP